MAKSTTSTPHDAVFKKMMTHPEIAQDFLKIHLPESLCKLCELTTLKLESTTFIEDDLRTYYSDVLWSLKHTRVRVTFTALSNIRVPPCRTWPFV